MHIRSEHYPEFHRASNTKVTYIFKTPSGQTIDFTGIKLIVKSEKKLIYSAYHLIFLSPR